MSALLVAAVALPALAALGVRLGGPRRAERTGRLAVAATGAALGLAVVLLARVATGAPVSAVVADGGGDAVAGLHADRVGAVLLVLVLGVSTVVQAFARRYLRGDARAAHLLAATALLTAASAALATAATLVGLAAAWTIAGIALCLLLGTYRGLPAADEGVRRTTRAVLIGDGALWLAVAIAVATWGDLDLRALGARADELAADPTALTLVAALLVVAALARSAQLPLGGWLPATLAAPTPVSALLHAGVVNAGGVLLVRLSPVVGASATATHLAFAAGAATALYGGALMLAKPDVKGALAHSTMGQMGFMVMTCGLGALAAAVVHLVAHGAYKATLFLGSGGAVRRAVRHAKAPPAPARRRGAGDLALAALLPAAALAAAVAVLHPGAFAAGGSGPLVVFAWASAAWAAWGWLGRQRSVPGVAGLVAAVLAGAAGYVALLAGASAFFAPALTGAGDATAAPWLLAPVLGALALATLARRAPAGTRLGELARTAYVLALAAGRTGPRPPRRRARRAPLAVAAPRPRAGLAGGRA